MSSVLAKVLGLTFLSTQVPNRSAPRHALTQPHESKSSFSDFSNAFHGACGGLAAAGSAALALRRSQRRPRPPVTSGWRKWLRSTRPAEVSPASTGTSTDAPPTPLVLVVNLDRRLVQDGRKGASRAKEATAESECLQEPPSSQPPSPASEDSITGQTTKSPEADFRAVVLLKAPGVKAAWASATLQKLMANAERFGQLMADARNKMWLLLIKEDEPFSMIRADLEERRHIFRETDIPRDSEIVERARSKASELPIDTEFIELRKNLMWSRPRSMRYTFHHIGEVNARAIGEGLEMAFQAPHAQIDPPHLEEPLPEVETEELSIWGCGIGNGGAVAFANAFALGCATALGAGLQNCPELRDRAEDQPSHNCVLELSLPKNPLGKGFASLLSGLGETLKVLDASEASLDDAAAQAIAAAVPRFPLLRSLRLAGNVALSLLGVEAVVRSMLHVKDIQQVDLRGSSAKLAVEWHRLMQLLERGGMDPRKLRLKLNDNDFSSIEGHAQQISKESQPFLRCVVSKEEALELFKENPFKVQLITNKVPDGALTSCYRCGDLIDLCRGPHLPNTNRAKAFLVTKNSAAYWCVTWYTGIPRFSQHAALLRAPVNEAQQPDLKLFTRLVTNSTSPMKRSLHAAHN
eukprot:s645_g11.t1